MKSTKPGKSTSPVEVVHISGHGFWLHVAQKEYFLPFSEYPWFKNARVGEILNVRIMHGHHLRWPLLDVDLELESLENLEKFPLVYK